MVFGDLRVIPSKQLNNIRGKFRERFVDLGSLWFWNLHFHSFLAEIDSIAKHFTRKLFVEVGIHSLRIFGSGVIRNIACANRLSEQYVVIIEEF